MWLYADAIERALVAALQRLVISALTQPFIHTIDDALAWYETPWLQ
jgi:hypothetical protein